MTCAAPATDASHVRHGAGKRADELVPQCRRCHRELHQVGIVSFQERGVDLAELAADFAARWRRR